MDKKFVLNLTAIIGVVIIILFGMNQCTKVRMAEQDTKLAIAKELTDRSSTRNDTVLKVFRRKEP